MDARVNTPRADTPADNSLGDLFHQLVDDGRLLVSAEVDLYTQIALTDTPGSFLEFAERPAHALDRRE